MNLIKNFSVIILCITVMKIIFTYSTPLVNWVVQTAHFGIVVGERISQLIFNSKAIALKGFI